MRMVYQLFWNFRDERLRFLFRLIGVVLTMAALMMGARFAIRFFDPSEITSMLVNTLVGSVIATAVFWLSAKWIDRRPFSDFGLANHRLWWRDLVFGLVLGVGLMAAIFAVEYSAGWVSIVDMFGSRDGVSFTSGILLTLLLFTSVGYFEELVARGYLVKNLSEAFNFSFWGSKGAITVAVVLSSGLFGLAHASNPNATTASVVSIFLAGVFLALPFILTGRLAMSIGLHISWNFAQGSIFGFPVSGVQDKLPARFLVLDQQGPAMWTGGDFGPEGGLLGVIAVLVGILVVILYTRMTEHQLQIHYAMASAPHRSQPTIDEEAQDQDPQETDT